MTRPQLVPDDVRAALVGRMHSKHKGALPAQLETGRLYQPVDPAAGGQRAELRVLVGHDGERFYLDYFTRSDEATAHLRVFPDGTVTKLDNYQGQFGTKSFPDPADTARERERVAEHNRRVRAVLKQKGFED